MNAQNMINPERPGADRKVEKVLMVDTDGERFAIRLLRDRAGYDDLEKVRNFPQRKWSAVEGAWLVPLTDPNVAHLFASWSADIVDYTAAARLLVDYHLKTKQVADVRLKERLSFLSNGDMREPEGYEWASDVPPHAHQKVAFSSARTAEYFALLMEMGTGKSKVVVDVISDRAREARRRWMAKRTATTGGSAVTDETPPRLLVLVVAPKTVTGNWIRELEKHTTIDMNVERIKGGKLLRMDRVLELLRDQDEDGQPLNSQASVAIINYEGLQIPKDQLKLVPWDLMVLDESILIKNPNAKRTKAAIEVGRNAKSRFILTGLPITKHVVDLYSQFDFLKSGALGYTSYYAYANHFSEERHWGGPGAWRKDKLPELQERLARFSFIIRRDQCLTLPPKQYQTLEIEMGDEQARAYESMLDDMIVDLEQLSGKDAQRAANAIMESSVEGLNELVDESGGAADGMGRFAVARIILTKLLRLSQITSGYMKLADKNIHRFDPNPKVEALRELLEESDDADKFVVWSCFREDIARMHEAFRDEFGAVYLQGGMREEQIERNLRRFAEDPRCRLFIGNQAAGGKGLNLVEANNVVYFANNFNLDHRAQSEDRAHRIGQTRHVLYTDLVVPNSIDQIIVDRLREKRDLADLLTNKDKIVEALKVQLLARRQE